MENNSNIPADIKQGFLYCYNSLASMHPNPQDLLRYIVYQLCPLDTDNPDYTASGGTINEINLGYNTHNGNETLNNTEIMWGLVNLQLAGFLLYSFRHQRYMITLDHTEILKSMFEHLDGIQ